MPFEDGIVHIAAREQFRERVANKLADAQLPRGAAGGLITMVVDDVPWFILILDFLFVMAGHCPAIHICIDAIKTWVRGNGAGRDGTES